jgi:HlyD family secretion protein
VVARLAPAPAPLLDARTRAELKARLQAALAAQRQAAALRAGAEEAKTQALRELERHQPLLAAGAVTTQVVERLAHEARARAQELVAANQGARIAAHEAELARAALARTASGKHDEPDLELLSPVGGVVLKVQRESEGLVQPGAPLVEVGDAAALEIVVDVLTQDAARIRPGASVQVTRWGGGSDLVGHVRAVEPSAFTLRSALGIEEQRVNVLVDLDSPREQWSTLGDGYRVDCTLLLDHAKDVLTVPMSAVFRHGERWATYRMRGGRAELAEVELGLRSDETAEVRKGLEQGDRVILFPGDAVREGTKVEPR